jgi:hypothetical protein
MNLAKLAEPRGNLAVAGLGTSRSSRRPFTGPRAANPRTSDFQERNLAEMRAARRVA